MDTISVFNKIKTKFNGIDLGLDDSILVCGNSLDLLKQIPDHSIALILTDPPYHSTKKKNIIGDTSFTKDSDYIEYTFDDKVPVAIWDGKCEVNFKYIYDRI